MAPCTNLVSGTYINVKNQEYVDFLIKKGAPADVAKSQLNTTWTSVVKELPCGSFLSRWSCKEQPEMNDGETFALGKVVETDTPVFGGKARLVFNLTGDNTFDCSADTDKMGKFTWTEKYTPEGLYVEYANGDKTIKELWERQYSFEGWYKLDRSENLEGYMKAAGMDPKLKDAFEGSMFCFKPKNGGYEMLEQFQTQHLCHFFKFDEEFDYDFPGVPALKSKCVVTKVNGHSMKMLVKKESGVVEEWTAKFCPLGAMMIGTVKGSDEKASTIKCFYKRYHNPFGKYKVVAEVGLQSFLVQLGVPESCAKAVCEEQDFYIAIEDKGNGLVHYVVTSKIQPQDMTIKFGEEFEMESPLLPGTKMKGVTTLEGDTMMSVIKSPKGTMKGTFKLGTTFCVAETCLVDTGAKYKAIFERV